MACYTLGAMADSDDSLLDKTEKFARRVLERLGAKGDQGAGANQPTLSQRKIGEITSRLERTVDANLRDDQHGTQRVAPHRFEVQLTYEESTSLSADYLKAVAEELTASLYEYINNRRYELRGAVEVKLAADLFVQATTIKAHFANDVAQPQATRPDSSSCTITLRDDSGSVYPIKLKSGEGPQYLGRAAGVVLRIDDASVSRLHCSIILRASGEVALTDVGSANGTSLNGRGLSANTAHNLAAGDVIEVGDIRLHVADIA